MAISAQAWGKAPWEVRAALDDGRATRADVLEAVSVFAMGLPEPKLVLDYLKQESIEKNRRIVGRLQELILKKQAARARGDEEQVTKIRAEIRRLQRGGER